MNRFLCVLIIIFAVLSAAAIAEDKSRGCGPASVVAPQNTMVSTSTRATTDFYLFPFNWSATSSGTSGCKKHEIVENQKQAHEFLVNNYNDLMLDISVGGGEFLNVFASSLGCSMNEINLFTTTLQKNYKTLIKENKNDEQVFFYNVIQFLKKDKVLSNKCRSIAS